MFGRAEATIYEHVSRAEMSLCFYRRKIIRSKVKEGVLRPTIAVMLKSWFF